MLNLRFLLSASLVIVTVGCASQSDIKVRRSEGGPSPVCDKSWQVQDAPDLELDLPYAEIVEFTSASRCVVEAAGAAVTYAAFRLPEYVAPWILRVESHIDGRSLFAPEIMLLSADKRVLRRVRYDRFSLRGAQLQTTVFFNTDNAEERYILIRSAPNVAGRGTTMVESGYFVVPIIAGLIPLFYMQGTEREREYVLSHSGLVRLYARSESPPVRRRSDY